MTYCPDCGREVESGSSYCLNCGKKLPEDVSTRKISQSWESPPTKPYQPPDYQQQVSYRPPTRPVYQPRPYHPSMKASLGDRCIALLGDEVISCVFACCSVGCVYDLIKDTIRDGQSIGKGMVGLRVIDHQRGIPATMGQSITRNCTMCCVDVWCCYLVAFIDKDGRHIGDHMAGTVVIRDM